MTQQLRAALLENPGSVHSTYMVAHINLYITSVLGSLMP